MNDRERFIKTLEFEKPDRVPYFEQYIREDTVERWHKEGLPQGVNIEEYFHLDHREVLPLKLSYREMNRRFDYPIENERDLERFGKFLESARKKAYPRNWKQMVETYRIRDYPVGVGAWESGILQFLGVIDSPSLTRACLLMCDNPKLVRTILDMAAEYLMKGIEPALEQVDVDFAYFTEPIAGSNGPVISPEMFRDFVIPQYKKIAGLLKQHGTNIIILRSFGNIEALLPDMVKAGVNGLWLTETAPSRMDYRTIRKKYGKKLALIGGIDSNVLTRDKDTIRKEILEKVPPLLKSGGYIPTIDNRARAHIPFDNFVYYRNLLEEISAHP
jgi:uroporphyrinogen decarboxylase